MLYSDYSENGVITSCIPTIKRTEKKLISTVNANVVVVPTTNSENNQTNKQSNPTKS